MVQMLQIIVFIIALVVILLILGLAIPVDLIGTWQLLKSDYPELGILFLILGGSFVAYFTGYLLKKGTQK